MYVFLVKEIEVVDGVDVIYVVVMSFSVCEGMLFGLFGLIVVFF